MFKKPYSPKTASALRSSDRRKLAAQVASAYGLADDVAKRLVPEGLQSQKFLTHLDEQGSLYLSPAGDPLWFTVGFEQGLIPTVYTLWAHPTLLPTLATHAPVIEKLISGADLMAPGLAHKFSPSLLPVLRAGDLVAITEHATRFPPLAVGRMAVDTAALGPDAGGKAVLVLHAWEDCLWNAGSRPGRREVEVESEPQPEGEAKGEELSEKVDGLALEDGQDARPPAAQEAELTVPEIDSILRLALIQSITTTLSSPAVSFPLPASTVLSAHVLPARSARAPPQGADIRGSSWKKASKFFKAMDKEGLIKVKEHKGDVSVMSINKDHPAVKAWKGHKTLAAAEKQAEKLRAREAAESASSGADGEGAAAGGGAGQGQQIVVEEVWKPVGGPTIEWFAGLADARPRDHLYPPTELRSLLNTYITTYNLAHPHEPSYIVIDAPLRTVLLKKGEDAQHVRRDELVGRLTAHMQAWTSVRSPGGERVVRKGRPTPFHLSIKQRQGRKVTTHVRGPFETFGLAPDALAAELKHVCASSTSVNPVTGAPKELEVSAQGDQTRVVERLLVSKGVPRRWIELDGGGKKK